MYLFFDLETGGKDPVDSDILTGAFVVTDSKLNVVDTLEMKMRPEIGRPRTCPEALAVNKINIDEHLAANPMPYSLASFWLSKLLKANSQIDGRLIPVGWRLAFDLRFIYEHLLSQERWEVPCSFKTIDVAAIASYLTRRSHNPLPAELSSLVAFARHFNIPHDNAHDAKADTIMTIEVFRRLLEI